MNKVLKTFLSVGNELAKSFIPGLAVAETSIVGIKKGVERKKNVVDLIKSSPAIVEAITNKDFDEQLFNEAVDELNDGYAKLLKACQAKA